MIYGYARVSTDGQTLADQTAALVAAGAEKVFRETVSGVKDRPQLRRAIGQLERGDVLLVIRLDRLGRSALSVLNVLADIASRKAAFRSITQGWADSTTSQGRMMLTFFAGFAEFERELILERTSEGRARAKARGQSLGRPFKLTHHQRKEARGRVDRGESVRDVARSYNVHPSTISRLGP
jgi:DNA invertase Pin-like site-specific DNA recombinase